MKAEKRKAERKWQRTHDDDDKKAFNELRTILTNHIRECKKSYIQDKIKNAPQTQKGLFGCMQDLIYKPKGKALPTNIPIEDLPDIICEFFVTKIRKIQSKLNSDDQQLDSEVDTSNPVNELFAFDTATEEEIEKIIKASPTKSCSLDAIPTFLLKQCLDVLLPCLTMIVNQSLSSASVPVALKQAMVTPLLKKNLQQTQMCSPTTGLCQIFPLYQRYWRKWSLHVYPPTRKRTICMKPFNQHTDLGTPLKQHSLGSKMIFCVQSIPENVCF